MLPNLIPILAFVVLGVLPVCVSIAWGVSRKGVVK